MRKLFTLLVLFLVMGGGVNSANAEVNVRLTADMFKSWSSQFADGEITGSVGCSYVIGTSTGQPYGDGNVDYRKYANFPESYKKLVVVASAGQPRFLLNRTVDNADHVGIPNDPTYTAKYQTIEDNGDGTKNYVIDLDLLREDFGFAHLHAIKGANWQDVTVTKMYMVKDGVIEAGEVEEKDEEEDNSASGNLSMYNYLRWSSPAADATIAGNPNENQTVFGVEAETPFGHGAVWNDHYADLSAFKKLEITIANGAAPRPLFNRQTDGTGLLDLGNNETLKNKYVSVSAGDGGTLYTVDIAGIVADYGFAHLQCIKGANYSRPNIVSLKVRGEQNDIDALMNQAVEYGRRIIDATLLDATAWDGSSVDLTNPNCILLAKAGTVSNVNNVMVGTTIANLSLSDGHPFAVPAGASATAATYSRTVTDTYGTICLPYAVASDANVQYYTLGANDGESLTIVEAANVAAGTPAIFKKLGANDITFTGAGALADAQDGSASTGTVMTMKGTYTQKKVTDTEELAKLYYVSDDQIMQATASLTINPFRAYMEASSTGSARIRLTEADVTAINAVFNAENSDVKVVAIYGANGAQQSELKAGVNIVKLSNNTVKKIIVK